VRSEWQFPQARAKTSVTFEFDRSGTPRFLGSAAERFAVTACPTIKAAVANTRIDFSGLVVVIEFGAVSNAQDCSQF